jgi:pilus assembly protein FimV
MAKNAVRLIAPALLGALVLLFPADGLRALGLGEARVDSWLGQPLDVSIRLLEIEDEAVESVSVGPASLDDFERLGVPSDSLGLGLEVTVDRRAQPPIVRVRSQQPVSDPVVQILIDARWSSGRVLREYTLFLDPPVMDSAAPVRRVSDSESQPQAAEPAARPEPTEPATERQPRPVSPAPTPSEPASSEPSASQPQQAAAPAGSVRVQRGDTLWSIAQDWRPDSSMTMDQVMLAIFNRNRSAFLGENINRLRSDALLDMPEMREVRDLDREEAQRLVREQMRSWQPGVVEDVPVVSDAAMPDAVAETEQTAASETDTDAPEEEEAGEDFRLDVVPPEEEQYSESSAVADSEIQRVRDSLSDVEEQIVSEGLESEAFDDHAAEIREALEQRDMAGLAVAEESLAELETRLRETREARAEQERMAEAADAAGEGEADEISDYMSELEEEFGAGQEQADADQNGAMADANGESEAGGDSDAGTGESDESQAEATDSEAMAEADDAAAPESTDSAEAESQTAESQPMAVTRTSSDSAGWLMPALGVLAIILVAVGAFWFMRRKRQEAERAEPSLGAGDAVDSARAAVQQRPSDLGAHLALLKLLADEGREQEFTDAFDQMYQEVDDESAPEWQEALSLAAAHVPDHPLLTPHETTLDGEDEDFNRRADEMLGMLESGDEDDFRAEADRDDFSADDDTFDLGGEAPESADDESAADDKEDTFDNDMDLAVLSERLDDPSKEPGRDKSLDEVADDSDFGEFEEIDEYAPEETDAGDEQAPGELNLDLDDDDDDTGLDLDFEPSKEQEADDVFGEAGTRDTEDLDVELTSDAEESAADADDDGLDFDRGEDLGAATPAAEPDEAAEEAESEEWLSDEKTAEEAASDDSGDALQATGEAGGSLSDDDADVKLDLARAYISVDLADSARSVLEEVVNDGSAAKRDEAQKLLDDLD